MLHDAARCCHVTSESRSRRVRQPAALPPRSHRTECAGDSGAKRSRDLRCRFSGRSRPLECGPHARMRPVAGSSQSRSSSSTVAPPAMAHPFHAPAEAPTTRSIEMRSRSAFQTPTSQAAYKPAGGKGRVLWARINASPHAPAPALRASREDDLISLRVLHHREGAPWLLLRRAGEFHSFPLQLGVGFVDVIHFPGCVDKGPDPSS